MVNQSSKRKAVKRVRKSLRKMRGGVGEVEGTATAPPPAPPAPPAAVPAASAAAKPAAEPAAEPAGGLFGQLSTLVAGAFGQQSKPATEAKPVGGRRRRSSKSRKSKK